MKSNPMKIAIRFFLFHLLYTAIAWLFFTIFFSGIRNQMIIDEMFKELGQLMFGFSLVTFLIFEFVMAFTYFKNAERKRNYLALTEGGLSPDTAAALRKGNLKEALIITATALIVQLPIAIFYSAFGYGFANALGFERFSIGWIGFYEFPKNVFVGMIINLGIVFCFSLASRVLSHQSWEKNRIRK